MSRIGKKPVAVPDGVKIDIAGKKCNVSGPKGQLSWELPECVSARYDDGAKAIEVHPVAETKQSRALHGTSRALLANMVRGVSQGYERRLLIYGTGYGCKLDGKFLCLNVGFMGRGSKDKSQFRIPVPDSLDIDIETAAARGDIEPAKFVVRGCDKQVVGQFAAEVRKIRPPEPYKGKGIRYDDEHVRKKQGKAFASGG
ncbi:MAG: 50S ribosomal protein L6 [Phycisphaerae bacterium]|nr:50S ribosomal protein L6 [Phycisphaerae bacterium]